MNIKVTKEFLENLETSNSTIEFLESNKLLPTTTDFILSIENDHDNIISELKATIENGIALDGNNNPVCFDINGKKYIKLYDVNNNNIYMSRSDGIEVTNDYDDDGNLIETTTNSINDDTKYHSFKYDTNGLLIEEKVNSLTKTYRYDDIQRLTHIISNNGVSVTLYSGNERVTFDIDNSTYEKTDDNGNVIYHQSKYVEYKAEYDQNNIQTYYEDIKNNKSSTTKIFIDIDNNKLTYKQSSTGYSEYRHEDFNGNTLVLYSDGELLVDNKIEYYPNGQIKRINAMKFNKNVI